jgi:outer membrane receptor protein involved in Fe transport
VAARRFAQSDVKAGPVRLFGGLRHSFTGQGSRFLSPSGGAAVGRGRLRGRVSVYRSFRAPTLNELFREFRAGNTDTRECRAAASCSVPGGLTERERRPRFTAYRTRWRT